MPDLNENDLIKLFKAAGHRAPERDLTARVMARVAVTPILRLDIARPLISKRAWWGAGVGLAALVVTVALLPHDPGTADGPVSTALALAEERISRISIPTSWLTWTAMTVGGLLFFTWVDATLARSGRRTTS